MRCDGVNHDAHTDDLCERFQRLNRRNRIDNGSSQAHHARPIQFVVASGVRAAAISLVGGVRRWFTCTGVRGSCESSCRIRAPCSRAAYAVLAIADLLRRTPSDPFQTRSLGGYMRRRTFWAGTVVAVTLSIVGGQLIAQDTPQQGQASSGNVVAFDVEPQTLFQFVGGPLKRVWADVNNSPTQIGETVGFNLLPNADVTAFVAPNGNDMFVLTFSGECRLFGAGIDDWVQLEAIRTQTFSGITTTIPIQPQSPTGADSMAFCGANSWNMNSAQFAVRLGAGSLGQAYRFRIRWRIVDSGLNNALRAWLDDWTFKVEQYE
jgi:hypothetical protein